MQTEGEERSIKAAPSSCSTIPPGFRPVSHSTFRFQGLATHDQGARGDQTLTEVLSANERDGQIAIRSSPSIESP